MDVLNLRQAHLLIDDLCCEVVQKVAMEKLPHGVHHLVLVFCRSEFS
jgi:hypothetical protein